MIELSYDTESPEFPPDGILALMRSAADAVAEAYGIAGAEVSVVFAPPAQIRTLNREHRGIDEVTDVLSFPQQGGAMAEGAGDGGSGPPLLLGDIVICPERARSQAEEYGHGEEREFVYLFVHGLLHLLGFDHGSDAERAAMREAEERIMREAGL
jgi:probable rRNA maturation factor